MGESTGKTGRGVTLSISDGTSPAVYTQIANVTSINLSGRDADEIDFTHLGSTGGFREFRQGFKDGGTISFDMHFTPTEVSHVDLLALWLAGTTVDWKIDYSGAGWDYAEVGQGFIKNPSDVTVNVNDPINGAGTIRVTGGSQIIGV